MAQTKKIKIALLASFTAKNIADRLVFCCRDVGIGAEIYLGAYNQYGQEILNSASALYQFRPDLTIIFIDTRGFVGDYYFNAYEKTAAERRMFIAEKTQEIITLVEALKSKTTGKILFHNFEVPTFSSLGIQERKQEFGFWESLEALNQALFEKFRQDNRVFIFDFEMFCSRFGKQSLIEHKLYYLGDIKVNPRITDELCHEYLGMIKPMLALSKKCLVLDLDNTLWGGVVGEDGVFGIKLGPTPEGRPFWELQKFIYALFKRGVILAINSRNNLEDVMRVFSEHPHMILKPDHFAAMQINWNDKASNMHAIAEEINIGLDSMIFIDDDALNRDLVRQAISAVEVIDLPKDPAFYLSTLAHLDAFHFLQLTEEDWQKGAMYAAEKKRKDFAAQIGDLDEYLKSLGIIAEIAPITEQTVARASQLTQKTNQFNVTTRRYTEENMQQFLNGNQFVSAVVSVRDKFGDNGITGLFIIERSQNVWRIDTFLLSCRILGRNVEKAVLAYIIEKARQAQATVLIGEFIPTAKNKPAEQFFPQNNFQLEPAIADGIQRWRYDLTRGEYSAPEYIKVIKCS